MGLCLGPAWKPGSGGVRGKSPAWPHCRRWHLLEVTQSPDRGGGRWQHARLALILSELTHHVTLDVASFTPCWPQFLQKAASCQSVKRP